MTARISRLDTHRAPTSPQVFRLVVAITTLVTIAAIVTPSNDTVSVVIVVLVIALFGIPHGAVDHLVAATFGRTGPPAARLVSATQIARVSQRRFHLLYVAGMAAYGLVWRLFSFEWGLARTAPHRRRHLARTTLTTAHPNTPVPTQMRRAS